MLMMSASVPQNFEVKTFGLGSMPNIWIHHPTVDVDFEISHEDFNHLVAHYLWGGEPILFEDADGGDELIAVFHEPWAGFLFHEPWAGFLIKNKNTGKMVCLFEESDWVEAVKYVFTNDDLLKGDVRPKLLEECHENPEPKGLRKLLFDWFMTLKVAEGFNATFGISANPNCKRLSPGGM